MLQMVSDKDEQLMSKIRSGRVVFDGDGQMKYDVVDKKAADVDKKPV
jgi:hypothetical protein